MKRLTKGLAAALIAMLILGWTSAVCSEVGNPDPSIPDEVVFYYPTGDLNGLSALRKQVCLKENRSFAESIIVTMMEEPDGVGILPLFGQSARIESVENSLCVLTLNVETHASTDERLRTLSALAVWKVLSENTQLQGINVLVDSCAVSYQGSSLNTMLTLSTDVLSFDELIALAIQNRAYTVYLPEKNGKYLLPVLVYRTEELDDASAIISSLCISHDDTGFLCTWPEEFSLLNGSQLSFGYTQKNRRILNYSYEESAEEELKINEAFRLSGMQQWQLIASLALSLSTNLPDVERLSVKLLQMQIQALIGPDGSEMRFERGEIQRRGFQGNLAAEIGRLEYDEVSGKFRIVSALTGGKVLENSKELLASCLPEALQDAFSAVMITKNAAYIDLTGEFYADAQAYSAEQERMAVYAIVNAISINFGVNNVFFTVEEQRVDTLSGNLMLDSAFHPDYGLIEDIMLGG